MDEDQAKKKCKYASKCYRKNPKHLKEFSHDSDSEDLPEKEPEAKKRKIEDYFGEKPKKNESNKEEIKASTSKSKNLAENEEESNQASKQSDSEDDGDQIEAPASPEDVKENIKSKFLVEMPDDFYDFFDFAKSISSKHPTEAFNKLLGLQLVGPFDVLAGKCKKTNSKGKRPCYLRHWRYYYDPPEFLTVLRGDDATQFHMGYFRDDPSEKPVFMASNAAKDNGTITSRGENIYAAVSWFIDDKIRKDKSKKAELEKLKNKLQEDAKKHGYTLELKTKNMKARDKKSVCRTLHGAGMVVPVDENEVGYREVPETPGDLKKMFKRIHEAKSEEERNTAMDPLMEIIMLVQFANDECDYGEGLELGLDMLTYGSAHLHGQIMHLVPLAYQLLGRHEYGKVITAHLKDRRHTANLSQLE